MITEGRFFDGKLNLTQYDTELIESLRAYKGNDVAYCVFAIHESGPISIKNLSDFLKAFQALTNNERLKILLTGPLMREWLVLKESLEAFIEFADVSFWDKKYILDCYLRSLANRGYFEIYEIMDYIKRNFRENGTLSKDDIRRISDCISSKNNRHNLFGSKTQKVLEILDILTKFLNKDPPSYEPEATRLPMIG